jgi:glycogenin glucosyltransferase
MARTERRAFVTLLMVNDSYLPGCIVVAHSLRMQGTTASLVCLVTSDVTRGAREALHDVYDEVVAVDEVKPERAERGTRQNLPRMLTRFAALRLGPDGDLGHAFDRVCLLDADLLPRRDFDELWSLPAPAGVLNERREHMVELDPDGRIVPPDEAGREVSIWHDVYAACPHGAAIPKEITDRVRDDPTNFGINGSLFVLTPSMAEHDAFMTWIGSPEVADLVRDEWPWPDMQAATLFWSGRWTNVDLTYSTMYGYPSIDAARGLHFAGVKPWAWRKKGFARRLQRFPDHQLWASAYRDAIDRTPSLRRVGRLQELDRRIREALAAS